MDNENDKLNYLDTINELGTILRTVGTSQVAADLREYFPKEAQEFGRALVAPYRPVAALLKA